MSKKYKKNKNNNKGLRCSTVGDFVTDNINTTVTSNGNDSLKITKINTLLRHMLAYTHKSFSTCPSLLTTTDILFFQVISV